MILLPCPRQQFVETVDGMSVDHPLQHVTEVGVGLDVVELAGLDQRAGDCPAMSAAIAAGEEMILTTERNYPSILPMSGRMLKSFIAGMRFMDAVFD